MSQITAAEARASADEAKVVIDCLMAKAKSAMEAFENADQETVDEAVTALAWSIYEPARARKLAETASAIRALATWKVRSSRTCAKLSAAFVTLCA